MIERCDRAGLAAVDQAGLSALPEAMRALDEAALDTMAAVLRRAGLFRPGVSHRADQVLDRLRVADRHRWIVRGWVRALVRHGRLQASADGAVLRDLSPAPATPAPLPELCARLGYPPEVATFFTSAAARLPELLRDEVTLQSVLFGADSTETADGVYRENVINSYLNAALVEVLRGTLPPAPRVLELGAGVGATAVPVLTSLTGPLEYLFTDVSRYFLDTAGELLSADGRVRFGELDINEPASHTVDAGSCDAVIAANVLHNAIDVNAVLTTARSWLRPGGLLLVVESCGELLQAAVSMQLLMSPAPGRPAAGSLDLRAGEDRIFLTRDEWVTALRDNGLSPVLDLPHPDHPLSALGQLLLVATPTTPGATR
ncbi:class I SAM-dependent methyltransferase [Lentzea albida]|uniref:Methyltransferase domain-containing protein n=1 Tax=Lentzea albida TaxID=65499 RepID=A0A1H9WS12_9PSEU|nr:class I SAM-dependent methyltransferase [Lentzea albida]SES36710.1 Methyltransferase domain-containing protein [Lentzea albida]